MTLKGFIYEEEKLHLSVSDKAYCFNLERKNMILMPNSYSIQGGEPGQ